MKKRKAIIFIIILVVITVIAAVIHLNTREKVIEDTIELSFVDDTYTLNVSELEFEQITGTSVDGKRETQAVDGSGVLLKNILDENNITDFSKVTVIADDSYSAELTEEEVNDSSKVYLLEQEEGGLRLIVFGDENSERSVSNVVQIIVEKQPDSVTITDDLGREVTVENPQRVAALLGSYADMWVLAGGTVQASADDAWDDFNLDMPDDAVNLGNTKELSMEKLFASEPDFILASTNTRQNMEWKETLDKSGIPTAYFDVSDFDDYLRVLKICTDITGREDLYEKNGLDVQQKVEETIKKSKERVAKEGAPKVLFLRTSAASIRAKNSQDSVLGEMLKALGCENIADNDETLLENVSIEHILQEDPDFIFFVQVGDDKEAIDAHVESFINENPVWQELTAVKEERIYKMDKMLYNLKPNDRWGEAYEQLEEILADGQE